MICPDCEGKGTAIALVEGVHYRGPMCVSCSRCKGTGETDQRTGRPSAGQRSAARMKCRPSCQRWRTSALIPARWPQPWTSGIQTTFRSTSSFNDLTMPDRRSNASVVENAASVAE
jgi:hypothetical protein